MKSAVFISGQARTLASCFPNAYWQVLRHLPDVHIFASFAADGQASSSEIIRGRFPDAKIEIVTQPDFPDADRMALGNAHGGYPCVVSGQNVIRAFWHYKKAWEMCENPGDYGVFVRMRPDLWFQEFEPLTWNLLNRWECWTAPWGSYGGINDRFAIMGPDAAPRYMTAFDRIGQLLSDGCPFHPETLTRAAVEEGGVAKCLQRLVTEFKIRRMASAHHPQNNPNRDREWNVPEPIWGIELLRASLTPR